MASAASSVNVTCANCAKALRLSARPAKGKKIKCPACGEAFLPELDDAAAIQEKPGAKARASSSKSKPKPSHDDDDSGPPKRRRRYDDEEEEDDAPPKKRKKAKKQAAGNLVLIVVLLVGGAVLFLSCAVVGLFAAGWTSFAVAKPNNNKVVNVIQAPVAVQGMDPLTFSNSIANANQRLASAGERPGRATGPVAAGQKVNLAEVQRTFKNMQDTLDAIKTETQAWKIPGGASAKNFYDSHQRFLKVQEDGINDFASIVKVLENQALSSQQKAQQCRTLAFQAGQKEGPALADLQATQRVFAAEHNIIIVPGR